MVRRDQGRTDMIKNKWGVSAHSRLGTNRRSKPMPHCEWDWPPERRFLHSKPLIDADPLCGSDPMDRRIADVVVKVIVGVIKVAVVVVILFVWLVYMLLRI
jgi:hypothetical protein